MPGSVNVSIRWTRPAGPVSLSTGIGNATALGLTTGVGGSSAPVITTTSLPGGTVGVAYSQTLTATGTSPITWSITSGSISPLTLNSSTGAITGTPTTATTLTATFRATNAYGFDEDPLSIVVSAAGALAPTVVTTSLPDITAYKNISIPLEASGLLPISWSISGGTAPNRAAKEVTWTGGGLPAGVALDQFTGQIRGKASAPVTGASFTVVATNAAGTANRTLSLNALDVSSGAPTFVTSVLTRAKVGISYEGYDLAGRYIYVDGQTPITYSVISGSLPTGITLNSGGLFGGTPTIAGTYSFTVRATNAINSADRAFSIEVVASGSALPVILNAKVPDAVINSEVSWHRQMVLASGAATPVTWSAVANANPYRAIPAGVTIDSATGLVSGTVTASVGEYRFLIQASNSAGVDQVEIAMNVSPIPSAPSVNAFKPTINVWNELSS